MTRKDFPDIWRMAIALAECGKTAEASAGISAIYEYLADPPQSLEEAQAACPPWTPAKGAEARHRIAQNHRQKRYRQ